MPQRNALAPSNMNGLRMQSDMGFAPYGPRYAEQPGEAFRPKGLGYFGRVPTKGGRTMTELSATFDMDGQQVALPLIVPTLSPDEVKLLQDGGEPTENIYRKAFEFAQSRRKQGRDPFAQPQDLRMPVPR